MTITYGIIEETYSLNRSARTSYGIAVYADATQDGTTTIIASVHDITSDKHQLEQLVYMCNHAKLSLIHLDDVIDDFFSISN